MSNFARKYFGGSRFLHQSTREVGRSSEKVPAHSVVAHADSNGCGTGESELSSRSSFAGGPAAPAWDGEGSLEGSLPRTTGYRRAGVSRESLFRRVVRGSTGSSFDDVSVDGRVASISQRDLGHSLQRLVRAEQESSGQVSRLVDFRGRRPGGTSDDSTAGTPFGISQSMGSSGSSSRGRGRGILGQFRAGSPGSRSSQSTISSLGHEGVAGAVGLEHAVQEAPAGGAGGRRGGKSLGYCFTLNHYTPDEEEWIRGIVARGEATWLVYQREIGAGGTPHLQGYVRFVNQRHFASVRALFCRPGGDHRAHLEGARGTWEQNHEYCTKVDSRDPGGDSGPFEFGDRPAGQGRRTDIQAAVEVAKLNGDIGKVIAQHPVEFVKYHRGLGLLCTHYSRVRSEPTKVHWYFGPTGTGKTQASFREATEKLLPAPVVPGVEIPPVSALDRPYWKPAEDKWWDGYCGQACVIIDDFRLSMCGFDQLLRLFDGYPLLVPRKGDHVQFLATDIWITSPLSPEEMFGGIAEDPAQLFRRLYSVKRFVGLNVDPVIVELHHN